MSEALGEALGLLAEMREELGTGAARALRRKGKVPAVIYGAGKIGMAIAIEEKEITKRYRSASFFTSIIIIEVEDKTYTVLPKAVDLHPIKEVVYHIDFVFVDTKEQKIEVPLVFYGKERSVGVKRGGFFNIVRRSLPVFCPVNNIPKNIVIDVVNMYVGQSIKAKNITLPEGCKLAVKADTVIGSITGRGGKGDAAEAAGIEGKKAS